MKKIKGQRQQQLKQYLANNTEEAKANSNSPEEDGSATPDADDPETENDNEQPVSTPLWAQKIILELGSVQQRMEEHLPTIQATTTRIETELSGLATRITQAEQRISDVEDQLSPLAAKCKKLEASTSDLAQKVDYLENYSRRNNLRIVNIPENMEGATIKTFTADLLKAVLQIPADQLAPELERVHRLGAERGQNEKPRTILLKLLRFEDKERILKASRKSKELVFRSQKFFIFQDYSVAVSRRRMEYNTIKAALHQRSIPFRVLFPARLLVKIGPKSYSFDSPSKAKEELSHLLPDARF